MLAAARRAATASRAAGVGKRNTLSQRVASSGAAHGKGTRSDKRHLPRQDEQQLRQLVKGGCAQEPSEASEAFRVAARARAHRTELDDAEGSSVKPGARLREEHGASLHEQHRKGGEREERQPQRCGQQHEDNVKDTLQCAQGPFG